MFGWFKKKEETQSPLAEMRETLFGDRPLQAWGAAAADGEPWSHFAAAAESERRGNRDGMRDALQKVLAIPGLESRHYLQAWNALTPLGVQPPADQAKHLYGVVLDVPVNGGLDTLAAYDNHTARYLNHSGAVIVWESPNPAMGARIEAVLAAGRTLAELIGPWEGPRPALPRGMSRISLLTPSGLHFGQAPFEAFAGDPMSAPLVQAATELMQALIHAAESRAGGG